MRKNGLIISSAALVAALIYVIFTLIAAQLYPQTYSPLTNWLSDLGNPIQNPSGAIYYNVGGILTSLALIMFFVGINLWKIENKKMKIFLLAAQISGVAFAFSFIMTAVFPLGANNSLHSSFSIMLFVFIGCFEVFSASAIRKIPAYPKPLPYFGFIVAIINFAIGVSFNFSSLFIGEWVMIGLFMAYILTLAGFHTRLKTKSASA